MQCTLCRVIDRNGAIGCSIRSQLRSSVCKCKRIQGGNDDQASVLHDIIVFGVFSSCTITKCFSCKHELIERIVTLSMCCGDIRRICTNKHKSIYTHNLSSKLFMGRAWCCPPPLNWRTLQSAVADSGWQWDWQVSSVLFWYSVQRLRDPIDDSLQIARPPNSSEPVRLGFANSIADSSKQWWWVLLNRK